MGARLRPPFLGVSRGVAPSSVALGTSTFASPALRAALATAPPSPAQVSARPSGPGRTAQVSGSVHAPLPLTAPGTQSDSRRSSVLAASPRGAPAPAAAGRQNIKPAGRGGAAAANGAGPMSFGRYCAARPERGAWGEAG